ncbi:hypothetical protein AAC387_Pa04g0658 [Persea americana]
MPTQFLITKQPHSWNSEENNGFDKVFFIKIKIKMQAPEPFVSSLPFPFPNLDNGFCKRQRQISSRSLISSPTNPKGFSSSNCITTASLQIWSSSTTPIGNKTSLQ